MAPLSLRIVISLRRVTTHGTERFRLFTTHHMIFAPQLPVLGPQRSYTDTQSLQLGLAERASPPTPPCFCCSARPLAHLPASPSTRCSACPLTHLPAPPFTHCSARLMVRPPSSNRRYAQPHRLLREIAGIISAHPHTGSSAHSRVTTYMPHRTLYYVK